MSDVKCRIYIDPHVLNLTYCNIMLNMLVFGNVIFTLIYIRQTHTPLSLSPQITLCF